jgi:hypothetical protein
MTATFAEILRSAKKEKRTKKERKLKKTKEGEVYGNCRSHGNRARMPSAIFSR